MNEQATTHDAIPHGTHVGYDRYKCRCLLCDDVHKTYNREYARRRYADNPNRGRAASALWRSNNRAASKAALDKYKSRPDVRAAACVTAKAWASAHVDQVKANKSAWKKKNATSVVLYEQRRRALKMGADCTVVTPSDWIKLCRRHDNQCAYCGATGNLTQDHIIPLSRGGRHSIGNLLPACKKCNCSKHTKLLIEWMWSSNDFDKRLHDFGTAQG